MSSDHIEFEGTVIESTRGSYKVQLHTGAEEEPIVNCHLGGKLKKNKIHVVRSDRVKVKMSPYSLDRGIVYFRL